MVLKIKGKAKYTFDGIPYMWESGDVDTLSSGQQILTASDGASGDRFGTSVAVGCGRIIASALFDNVAAGSAYLFDG